MQVRSLFNTTRPEKSVDGQVNHSQSVLMVQSDSGRQFLPEHHSPYGFVLNFEGHIRLKVDRYRYNLTNGFFPLNKNSVVELATPSGEKTINAVLVLDPNLLEEIIVAESYGHSKLLENPQIRHPESFRFVCRPYSLNEYSFKAFPAFARFKNQQAISDNELATLLGEFLKINIRSHQEMEQINAVRKSTRGEIYRRLSVARLYMLSRLDQPLQLSEIAIEAQMNRFHFLRLYEQLFGETPHQFLTRKRLELACKLLKYDSLSITEICDQLGFESLPSFSLLFKKHIGSSPSQYRQNT